MSVNVSKVASLAVDTPMHSLLCLICSRCLTAVHAVSSSVVEEMGAHNVESLDLMS